MIVHQEVEVLYQKKQFQLSVQPNFSIIFIIEEEIRKIQVIIISRCNIHQNALYSCKGSFYVTLTPVHTHIEYVYLMFKDISLSQFKFT